MGLYDEITWARKILDIPDRATMESIKERYKEEIKKWHPDTCNENKALCEEKTKEIIKAFKILLDYCNKYNISFSKEEVEKYISEAEFWAKKFGDDPLWGNSGKR